MPDAYDVENSNQATRRLHEYTGDLRDAAASMQRQLEHKQENNPHPVAGTLLDAVKSCVATLDTALTETAGQLP